VANLKFSSDIINDALFRAGEPTDGTSDYESTALEYLNRAYRALWLGGGEIAPEVNEPWLWLKKDPPGVLILEPVISLGTVAVVNNNANITFSNAPSQSVAGWFLRVAGHPDVFRISTHTAASTSAVLDSVYTGDSITTSFELMKLEYNLASDVHRVIAPMRVQASSQAEIEGTDLSAMEANWPLMTVSGGVPTRFALVTETKVRFNAAGFVDPGDYIRVEYDYLRVPADLTDSGTEEPLVPLQYRQVLADYMLFMLAIAKNDDRAGGWLKQAQAGVVSMASDNRARTVQSGRSVGAIRPRLSTSRGRTLIV
jgi:hypothetical protein